jgi:transcriptional regulator with XRE-family HTH domain
VDAANQLASGTGEVCVASDVDLEALGQLLLDRRNGRARREFAPLLGITHTYLKKLEEGRASVSLATLIKLSAEIPLLELLDAATALDAQDVERWVLANTDLRERVLAEVGGRVVVEARLPRGFVDGLRQLVTAEAEQGTEAVQSQACEVVRALEGTVAELEGLLDAIRGQITAVERGSDVAHS